MASILLVDDSEMIQKTVSHVLQRVGHEVAVAGTVREGISLATKTAYDLVLMDLNLPDYRGEEAIRGLRETMGVTAPILVISGEIEVDTVLQLQSFDVAGYVAKSEDFVQRLLEEVTKTLNAKK